MSLAVAVFELERRQTDLIHCGSPAFTHPWYRHLTTDRHFDCDPDPDPDSDPNSNPDPDPDDNDRLTVAPDID